MHVFYGDVRVGTIAIRSGNPVDIDPRQLYHGSHPRECTTGTAPMFETRVRSLIGRGGCFSPGGPKSIFRRGAINKHGRQRSIGGLTAGNACRTIGGRQHERRRLAQTI